MPVNLLVQFPISVTFYINDMVIDSQLPIPEMDLGGYVRVHLHDQERVLLKILGH